MGKRNFPSDRGVRRAAWGALVLAVGLLVSVAPALAGPCECLDLEEIEALAADAANDARLWGDVCRDLQTIKHREDLLCEVMRRKGRVCPRDAGGQDDRTAKVDDRGKVVINPVIAGSWCDEAVQALEAHENRHKEDFASFVSILAAGNLAGYRNVVCASEMKVNGLMAKELKDLAKNLKKECCGGWAGTVTYTADSSSDETKTTPDGSDRDAHKTHVKATVKVHSRGRSARGTVEVDGFILRASDSTQAVNCAASPLFPPVWGTSTRHLFSNLESKGAGAVEAELSVMVGPETFSVTGQIPDVEHTFKLTVEDELNPGCGKPTDKSPPPPQPDPAPPGDPFPIYVEGQVPPNATSIQRTFPGAIEGESIMVDLKKQSCK